MNYKELPENTYKKSNTMKKWLIQLQCANLKEIIKFVSEMLFFKFLKKLEKKKLFFK